MGSESMPVLCTCLMSSGVEYVVAVTNHDYESRPWHFKSLWKSDQNMIIFWLCNKLIIVWCFWKGDPGCDVTNVKISEKGKQIGGV